jgi:hypothetical protein
VLLANERRRVSQGCSVAWPEGQRNSAVSLRSDRPKTFFASPAPPERPEDHSCFAIALAGLRPKTLRSAARSTRSARRHIQLCDCSTPKARRLPESRTVPPSLTRRSTRLSGSVVGAGRDHPKSLSNPGHRRPTKGNAEASSFASVTPAPFLSRRLTGLTGGSPLQPMTVRPKTIDHVRAISVHRPIVSLARSFRDQRGLMSHLRNHRPFLAVRVCFSKLKSLNNLPIPRRERLSLDVMKLSPNRVRAKC